MTSLKIINKDLDILVVRYDLNKSVILDSSGEI